MEERNELLELLQQIQKENRRQARLGALQCFLTAVSLVCCAAVLLLVFQFLPQVDGILSQVQTVLRDLETATAQLASVDLESMVTDVNILVSTAQQSLDQTMGMVGSIDIDTLNKAIDDLAAVIEPLSKLTSIFR